MSHITKIKHKSNKVIKQLTVALLALALILMTPITVFTQNQEPTDEIIEVGKGLTIMPNLEGSDFTVENAKQDEVDSKISMFSTFSRNLAQTLALPQEGPYLGIFTGRSGTTTSIYKSSTATTEYTYIEPTSKSSGVVPILDEANGRYKIAISGIIGWIDKSVLKLSKFNASGHYNYYEKNSAGELIHYINTGGGTREYSGIIQGEAPHYLKEKTYYISFDGHYFYNATNEAYQTLIDDYNNNRRSGSVNPNDPFYNYFQWLPARTQSLLTEADLDNYLTNGGKRYMNHYDSRLFESSKLFVDNGHLYGSNHALAFASGIHESAWGTSGFAKNRNNFFGHAAYDSSPGMANVYHSADIGIANHYSRFLNWNYLDANSANSIYNGSSVGNKAVGMNVKYASDPYWGEKIAAHYYNMDKLAGKKDYQRYTLAVAKNNNQAVYKEASSKSGSPYTLKHAGNIVAVLNTITEGSNKWYQISSDPLLDSNKNLIKFPGVNSPSLWTQYNFSKSNVYVNSSAMNIISNGKDSKLLPQLSPTPKKAPDFDTKTTTVFALDNAILMPDWSTDYSQITSIKKGTKFDGVITSNGWIQVQLDVSASIGYIGYIHLSKVSLSLNGDPIQGGEGGGITPPSLPKPGTIKYKVNADSGLRLRKAPVNGDVITTLPNNVIVIGGEPLDGWIHVEYNGHKGYASADFLIKQDEIPQEPEPPVKVKLGDIDGKGSIDVVDMAMLQAHLRKIYVLKGNEFTAADIDQNGYIDVVDMAMLQAHLRKIYTIEGW